MATRTLLKRNKFVILSFAALLFVICRCMDPVEYGEIKGQIIDTGTNEPIVRAIVSCTGQFIEKNRLSNDSGFYYFSNLAIGEYTIRVTKSWYSDTTASVKVTGADLVKYDFHLRPIVCNLKLLRSAIIKSRTNAMVYAETNSYRPGVFILGNIQTGSRDSTEALFMTTNKYYAEFNGLNPGNQYFYFLRVEKYTSDTATFITNKYPAPSVIIGKADSITKNSAVLSGSLNPNGVATHVFFKYGKSDKYSDSIRVSNSTFKGTTTIPVYAQIVNLESDTPYHFCLKAYNDDNTVISNDITFRTK